jgi:hypothetical protein
MRRRTASPAFALLLLLLLLLLIVLLLLLLLLLRVRLWGLFLNPGVSHRLLRLFMFVGAAPTVTGTST